MGIKNMMKFNSSLIGSALWRIINQKERSTAFLHDRFLTPLLNRRPYFMTSSIWPSIRTIFFTIIYHARWIISNNSRLNLWTIKSDDDLMVNMVNKDQIHSRNISIC